MVTPPKPLALFILDGFGHGLDLKDNAMENTPCRDKLHAEYPVDLLNCDGSVIGLCDGQMGSPEAGHLHVGGGRFMPQDLSQVTHAFNDGSFFENEALYLTIDLAKANDIALPDL